MQNSQIVFTAPGEVGLRESAVKQALEAHEILIQTEVSVVSAGTELACLRGTESWAPFPFVPGYGSVGTVAEVGRDVRDHQPGDRIFTYGRHEQFSRANTVMETLPEGMKAETAVFARMAAVAITALRVADAELGDSVAVIGLGLVGNFAAQLFTLAGCDVIGIDPSASRREVAEACGIWKTLPAGDDLEEAVDQLTHGRKCRTVVDATGIPRVIESAPRLAARLGELILLGSPRGEYQTDLTPFLNYSHLAGFGNITIKGAHEFRFPAQADPQGQYRHSFASNVRILLDRLADRRLKVEPLLSHKVRPGECAEIYAGLRERPEDYMGVVFDWR